MGIISVRRLREFWTAPGRRDAMNALLEWADDVQSASWATPADVKATFGKQVDFVKTCRTRNTLPVFDIAGNKYRMIAAVHYIARHPERGRVYVLQIMTHAEYDGDRWKDDF